MSTNFRHRVVHATYALLGLCLLFLAIFAVSGAALVRRAQHLRDDVCDLQLGKSSFVDVSKLFRHYTGSVVSHDNVPASCSADGCTYVVTVENPFTKALRVLPRIAFFAKVRISDNVLRERYLCIGQLRGNRAREVFVDQSLDSKLNQEWRVVSESKITRVGVEVSPDSDARFMQLATGLRLRCLVWPWGCREPDDILPFLRSRQISERVVRP